jgi:hypothetical protein
MRQVYAHDIDAITPLDLIRGMYRRNALAMAA